MCDDPNILGRHPSVRILHSSTEHDFNIGMAETLRQQNENLQDNVQTLQSQIVRDDSFEEDPLDLQPLAEVV